MTLKLQKLRDQLVKSSVDGILVTSPTNRRYLTDFTGTSGVAIVSATQAKLITDYRYIDQAKTQSQDFDIIIHKGHKGPKGLIFEEVGKQVNKMGIKKLAFEKDHLSYGVFSSCNEYITAEMIPTSGIIEILRKVKTDVEIGKLKIAADIADNAFNHILEFIRPGISEIEISNELEFFMRNHGAAASAFDTIVASGWRSSLPHGVASDKKVENGDMITLDFGANYQGYRSDICRTIALGQPIEQLKRIHAIVLEAFQRCVEGLKPGLSDHDVDALMRNVIRENDFEDKSGTGTGHGVGLDIHEKPFFSTDKKDVLQANMVITVEPGIYLPGVGGARVEDVILITPFGSEVLTPSAKELIIL
ncbi:M24 family metallopeptidase [Scopulibacillus darangshiensis]|uniref:M24 family metallopeptidase n=1 Tax=Scopulibacillus darangshiensis TaxID=442528 RepID=UPI002436E335|nr:Xaa-Pro peptidase family protein [Scopulibacillus darangshiensis]